MSYGRWTIGEVFQASPSEFASFFESGGSATRQEGSPGMRMAAWMLSVTGGKKADYFYFLERYRELEKAWEKERLPLAEVDRLRDDLEEVREQTGSAAGGLILMRA